MRILRRGEAEEKREKDEEEKIEKDINKILEIAGTVKPMKYCTLLFSNLISLMLETVT